MERRIIRRTPTLTEQIVSHAENDNPEPEVSRLFVPTGSALLNLALSDRHDGGYLTGKIVNVIGDSSSGKTFLCLTTLAETAHNPAFDDYLLIFDDAEAASEFNIEKLFGSKTAERIMPPSLDPEEPGHSHTMMDFQSNIRRLLKGDKPFIYIQDSFDALTTDEELKHADKLQKAHDKVKNASILLRLIAADIKHTQSLVIIISQTRDNIDVMSFQKRTRAGGKALYFYCSYEMWLAIASRLTKKINDKNRAIGVATRIKITKNKHNGKVREIELPIYYSYGMDDIGGCVDFLVEENHWDKNKSTGSITAGELRLEKATRAKIISTIEERDWTKRLHELTQSVWLEIEEKLKLDRKPKYGGEE
jgi:recombination protein RecA